MEFKVVFDPGYGTYDIYLLQKTEYGKRAFFTVDSESGELQGQTVDSIRMEPVKPLLRLSPELLPLLATAIRDVGIQPAQESNIAGKYEAQSRHLEDLRRLIFRKEYKP